MFIPKKLQIFIQKATLITTSLGGKLSALAHLFSTWATWSPRGILVKLVICMSPGHPKIKIANFMKYITFAPFLPLNTKNTSKQSVLR